MNIEELQEALKDNTEIKNFITSMVSTEVETLTTGLKDKNIELLDEKKKLQTRLDGIPTKEELSEFKKLKEQIESSVDAKLISEGKLDDVINKRTERIRSDFDAKLTEATTEMDTLKNSNTKLKDKYNDYVVEDSVRKSAIANGVIGNALDDVVSRASGVFSLDSDGTLVSRDSEGKLVITNDGKTLTPDLFIMSLKQSAPHFWPQSKGSGLKGSDESTESMAATAASGDIDSYLEKRRKQLHPIAATVV